MVSMSRKMPPPLGTTQHQQEQQQDQQDLQDAHICELCETAWKATESRFATIMEQLQRQVADQQQQQHQQTCDNTVQAPINPTNFQDIEMDKARGPEQLSQTNDEDSLLVRKSIPTSKEVVVDEQQTQPQAHETNISTREKKRSHQDFTGQDSGVTSTYTRRSRCTSTRKRKVFKDPTIPHFNLGIFSSQADSYETTQEKNTEEDITGSVDLDKDVSETIEAEEYPVPSALDETKNPTPSIDEIKRRASSPASKSLSDTKKLEMIAAAAEEVENSKVVEAVPLSIIPPDWNIASTKGSLVMLEKNECTTPLPAISKEADELDEELTKTVEKILNEKPKRRNPPRLHRLPERFRKLLFEFGKIIWADRTAFYSMREGTWIENSIIDAWAVILNKEEPKSDSPRRIFFGVSSFDTISRYYQQGSNKEEIKFTFYERLGLELEEQGLIVASLLAAKAIYFPVHYQDHYFLYVLLVEEKKVLVLNNIHAKDLDYYKPTKDLLFRFFKSYVACVFPRIELVSAQYTFTEVTLPSHKDKTPNAEDCEIYTMHHMERYDGGEYEDGTTLDFNMVNTRMADLGASAVIHSPQVPTVTTSVASSGGIPKMRRFDVESHSRQSNSSPAVSLFGNIAFKPSSTPNLKVIIGSRYNRQVAATPSSTPSQSAGLISARVGVDPPSTEATTRGLKKKTTNWTSGGKKGQNCRKFKILQSGPCYFIYLHISLKSSTIIKPTLKFENEAIRPPDKDFRVHLGALQANCKDLVHLGAKPVSIPVVDGTVWPPRPKAFLRPPRSWSFYKPVSIPVIDGTVWPRRPTALLRPPRSWSFNKPVSIPVIDGSVWPPRPTALLRPPWCLSFYKPVLFPVVDGTVWPPRPVALLQPLRSWSFYKPVSIPVVNGTVWPTRSTALIRPPRSWSFYKPISIPVDDGTVWPLWPAALLRPRRSRSFYKPISIPVVDGTVWPPRPTALLWPPRS
ncbi:OLC1v1016348C1 [Oldenlandia corymbosa var. corymbosa]|uniref:OLC1v1016348C1 n=1 Tax=Oldenlandia corymbosa var. corymbosa TaxID=529605 RepID=A0AAV1E597_OLDCO|nr:OLC1v1016348C1 [Oldenlandia corymbosa var. corymbosa]